MLVVESVDGSVLLVEPYDGTTQQIHEGSDEGSVVQATGSNSGHAVVWTLDPAGSTVGLWIDDDSTWFEAPFSPYFYSFAPDDELVAMLGDRGGQVSLAILDIEAGTIEEIDGGTPYFFDWRTDSRSLGAHIGGDFVGTVDLAGSREAIEVMPGIFQAPDWIDDDRLVTVVQEDDVVADRMVVPVRSDVAAAGSMVSVDVDTGQVRRLHDVRGPVAFEVSPDGASVAYVEGADPAGGTAIGELSVVPLDGGGPQLVSEGPVVAFEWSPTADRLLFLVADPESGLLAPHVWDGIDVSGFAGYVPTPVTLSQYLPFWDQYTRALTTWSPEGDAFAYAAFEPDGGEVWVQPVEGERRKVVDGEFVSWIGTPDGDGGPPVP